MDSSIKDIVNGNECHPKVLKAFSNQSPESERCESVELNVAIRKQIYENNMSKQPGPYRSSLCSLKYYMQTRKQDSMSIQEYEQRIHVLENQRAELLEVNKQWDQHFRRMRQIYERKIAELEMKLPSCQHNAEKDQDLPYMKTADKDVGNKKCSLYMISNDLLATQLRETKEENQLLRKQNALYNRHRKCYEQEIMRLNKVLSDAVNKDDFQVTQQDLDVSVSSSIYDDMRVQIDVLQHQIKIYEEDFQKERADRQRVSEEKKELLKVNERLEFQISKKSCKIVNCCNPKCQSKPCL